MIEIDFSSGTIHSGRDHTSSVGNPGIDSTLVPRRGRTLESQAAAAVSARLHAGKSLPSLILGAHDLPSEHVCAALAVSPLAALVNTALPMRGRRLIASHINDPSSTVSRRVADLETLKSIDKSGRNTDSRGQIDCPSSHQIRTLIYPTSRF